VFAQSPGRSLRRLLLFVITLSVSPQLWAHAVLMESTPTANATVSGSSVEISLRFNVRIDGSRSRVRLGSSDGTSLSLPLTTDSGPDRLQSKAVGLKPGAYKLIWQVLASDGHMTRGEIPFTVR
jgi:methionine-rich copper-binding protein CopC